MKRIFSAAILSFALALPGHARNDDIIQVQAQGNVRSTMDRLQAAVEGAGATVFARVDHAAGAASLDMQMTEAELLIFGNPELGTPAMQDNPLAGLYLPLRVLVYRDGAGQVWLAYEDPDDMLDDLGGIDDNAAYVTMMQGALGKLTAAAAQ